MIPPALEPWTTELALLQPEFIAEVGPWLPRLSAAIGPLRSRPAHSPTGEPNGFDGLSRRGTYERLLLTEWALALELPDEFIRRAAMAEHLFLQPARIESHGSKRTVALFDAGPDQLGPLRLVHLALLLVLKRRADQAGGLLQWGHLQRTTLHTDLDQIVGPMLFSDRSAATPTTEAIAAWREVLAESGTEDDLWVIGGPDAYMTEAHRVEITDPYDPQRSEAVVALHHQRGQRPLELVLPLPADPISARMIRTPFATRVAQPVNWPTTPGPVRGSVRFNASGGAFISHTRGAIRSWGTPRPGWQRPREYRGWQVKDEHPVAVGWYRKRLFGLVAVNGMLQHRLLEHPNWSKALPEIPLHPDFALPDRARPIGNAHVMPPGQSSDPSNTRIEESRASLLLEDARGALWVACFLTGDMTMLLSHTAPIFRSDTTYFGMIPGNNERTLVLFSGPRPGGNVQVPGMRDWCMETRTLADAGPAAWVHGFAWGGSPVVAIPQDDQWISARIRRYTWDVTLSNPTTIPQDEEVFGCEFGDVGHSIYTIASDSMGIRRHRRGVNSATLFVTDVPILNAQVSRSRALIAYWLANGKVGFYDPKTNTQHLAISVGTP